MFRTRIPAPEVAYSPIALLNYTTRVLLGAAILVALAGLLSGALGRLLTATAVATADRNIAAAIHAYASPAALETMSWVSRLHGTAGILAMSALVAAWLAWRGQRTVLPVLLASVPGGLVLNFAVKHAVHRARPETVYAAEWLASFSFPSGHTAGATFFYGFLVVLLWPRCRSPLARLGLLTGATAMVVLVSTSRVMLGAHYPSDCLGALAEGLLWLTICLAGRRMGVAGREREAPTL